jgi:hypothetical protein
MKRYPVVSLILANLVPVLGVIFLNWSLFSIMFFYWLESAVIGIYNVPKMLMAQVSEGINPQATKSSALFILAKIPAVAFFIIHYGIFMLVHGIFVFALFGPADLTASAVLLGIASLAISHGVSFKVNFVDEQEYQKVNLPQQMFAPYPRIIVMHLTIISCAFIVGLIGSPRIALVIMVLLKTGIDVLAHLREHRKLGTYV